MESELKSHSEFIYKKIEELTTKHRESEASEELDAVVSRGSALMKQCSDRLTTTKFSGKMRLRELEPILGIAREVKESLVEFEEKFRKYNLPRRRDSKSFEEYEERLREFMRIWKVEAEKGRINGERSLLEWVRELGEERMSTFEVVKALGTDLGIKISRRLAEYLWFLTASSEKETMMRNLEEVRIALECLIMEGTNSIVIDGFLAVVRFTNVVMTVEAARELLRKMEKADWQRGESEESEILPLILREVLRMEVAFRCPDLPMMLTDEVFVSMVCHLTNVFEKRLGRVALKMDELIAQRRRFLDARDEERLNHLFDLLNLRIYGIWDKLDIQPGLSRSC